VSTKFGILLPHFGHMATKERVIDAAPNFEARGLDSVWVRDHLMFQPHGFEIPSTTFMEPFTTLTAIASLTSHLVVGTATVVPFRHPLVTSQLFGGVSFVAGPGRLIAGIGAGAAKKPFEATSQTFEDRVSRLEEFAEILKLTWTKSNVSYSGQIYQFEDITIDPRPPADTPIWIGGSTPAAIRRSVQYGDGWLPGRCPLKIFNKLLRRLRAANEDNRRALGVGIIPTISIAKDRESALSKVNVEGLLNEARARSKFWDGPFETADDLEGILIAGSSDDCVEQVNKFIELDVDHLVFDLRVRLDDFDNQLNWLLDEILPEVKRLANRGSQ
jgi:alkanesulfonate monooxygenase SsuD/methylene tetrahydromethanopterin reductase-like flavin-dependent oxidoreductase (luciferase family)